jgi:hypothetical protein
MPGTQKAGLDTDIDMNVLRLTIVYTEMTGWLLP